MSIPIVRAATLQRSANGTSNMTSGVAGTVSDLIAEGFSFPDGEDNDTLIGGLGVDIMSGDRGNDSLVGNEFSHKCEDTHEGGAHHLQLGARPPQLVARHCT